jgi:pilus assembly protein CpaE
VLASKPDVLILVLSSEAASELQALNQRPPGERPPTILVGPSSDPQLLRQAMRAGARDFFTLPLTAAELNAAIDRIADEQSPDAMTARFTAVINACGGAGGSTIAANVAHILAMQGALRVALVDLDMQFGSLPLYFDMQPNDGLPRAVASVEQLDTPALEAHMLKHSSGLHVLGTAADHLVVPGEVAEGKLKSLLALLGHSYDQVVVDLPRQIDALTATVIQGAHRILVVMQQTLPHLREAKRLAGLLQREFEVPGERLVIIVNRWNKQSAVTWHDIKQALPEHTLVSVRNDYTRVSDSGNLGIPLLTAAPSAPVTADLQHLAEVLSGIELVRRKKLLSRLFL